MKNKKELIKQKMIESAACEFASYGFEKANINTISQKAGFGKGTIYNYFKNKDALLIESVRFASHMVTELARKKIANEKDVIKKLYLIIYSHFEFSHVHEELLKVLIKEGYSAPSNLQKKILEAMDECYHLVMEVIFEGKEKKIFASWVDGFTCANLLTGMLFHHDCTCWALKGSIKHPEKETKIIFNYLIRGICTIQSQNQIDKLGEYYE